MIVPSIDIQDGQAVQLIGGRDRAIAAGDPAALAERFGRVGETAVIDLDAAMGVGSNARTIMPLLELAECRVGGGIRDYETAAKWLDAGAARIIIGTAATPDLLKRLPRDRVVAALDADRGEVVDHGWTRKTGRNVIERMRALRSLVGGFLVTFVEREGRLQGLPMDEAQRLVEEAGDARLTVAGGVRESAEIAQADRLCADVQVGMALYTKRFSLAEGFASPLRSERTDGLWPTIVCNQRGEALGLAYSNVDSLSEAIETGRGVYFSRSRGRMWRKGETSGAEQRLLRVDVDCDRDTLRFIVDQAGGGFCHTGEHTCFGEATGLSALERTIHGRLRSASDDSYTRRLLNDPTLLAEKTLEEAGEVIAAKSREETVWEAADLLYFLMVRLAREGLSLSEVERELDRRARRVKRFNAETKENTP